MSLSSFVGFEDGLELDESIQFGKKFEICG